MSRPLPRALGNSDKPITRAIQHLCKQLLENGGPGDGSFSVVLSEACYAALAAEQRGGLGESMEFRAQWKSGTIRGTVICSDSENEGESLGDL